MATGLSAVNLANRWLDMLSGTTFTAPAGTWMKLHTADPGATGATGASAQTARTAMTWGAASAGVKATSASTSFAMTATETITHVSLWDTVGPAGGNFLGSAALTTSRAVANGDTLSVTSFQASLSPLAA